MRAEQFLIKTRGAVLNPSPKKPKVKTVPFGTVLLLAPQVGIEPTTLRLTAGCSGHRTHKAFGFMSVYTRFMIITFCVSSARDYVSIPEVDNLIKVHYNNVSANGIHLHYFWQLVRGI